MPADSIMSTNCRAQFSTHDVTNQPAPLEHYNVYRTDSALAETVCRAGADWAQHELAAYGALAGGEMIALGFAANENKPKFNPVDRFGNRLDQVEFHPAYHRLMSLGIEHGVANFTWRNADRAGANVARAALMYLHTQPDQGTSCPLTMTYASVPVLRQQEKIAKEWLPRILSSEYDPRFLPVSEKSGITIGMGMTEKQGGSDVRANTTRAYPVGAEGAGEWYELVGHKWFFSAPMCDAFLVLAQSPRGLSCFLLPRFAPDKSVNAIRLQRLKDKLGDWSNASSEVEFHGALAQMIGEEGRGVATILEMVVLTRQDCMIGSAGIMRQALVQAIHHTQQRKAFGKCLIDQPLMENVLADLALESEAALVLTMRVAYAIGSAERDEHESAFARIATAIGKYWVCKRCAPFVNEAQECLGGAGYVEESILPRLYRQAPLNAIWEGSGNIQCLDVLRALKREPASKEALFAELAKAKGASPLMDAAMQSLNDDLREPDQWESRARAIVEKMAVLLQASLLLQAGNNDVANSFCAVRLGADRRAMFGALPLGVHRRSLIDRAFPGL